VIGVEVAVLALLWSVGLVRLARRRPSAHHRAMTLSILAIALAATAREPSVAQALDRATGVPDLAALVRTLSGLVAVAAAWVFTSAVTRPELPRPYRRPVLYLTVIAVMTGLAALFLMIHRLPGPGSFAEELPDNPLVVVYELVVQLAFVAGAARGAVLFWTQARTSGRTLLRTGLLVLCASAAVDLVYLALQVTSLLSHALRVRPMTGLLAGPQFAVVEENALTLALLLFAIGCALPGLAVARDYATDYRALVRLYWLWHTLQRAVPGFVLGRAASRVGDLVNPFGVRMRLYRRVIEIRDAQWSLGAPVDPDPASEAAVLVVALSIAGKSGPQWRRIAAPAVRRLAGRPRAAEGPVSPLDREVHHLLQVAEYFDSAFRGPVALSQPPQQRERPPRPPERVRVFRVRDVNGPLVPAPPAFPPSSAVPPDPAFSPDHRHTCRQGP
jgi:hypothetical protein